jgi:PAS domain S-box-containing protein
MSHHPGEAAPLEEAESIAALVQSMHGAPGAPAAEVKTGSDQPLTTSFNIPHDVHRDSEHLLRTFIDNSPSVIFLKDSKGRYILINRQFEKQFRLTTEQVVGRTDPEIFPLEQATHFQANDQRVLRTGVALEFEERAHYADGSHVSIVSKFPLRDSAGNITGVCGIATDITERKRMEEALRTSTANLAAAQSIAHFGSWELDYSNSDCEPVLRWSEEMFRIAGLAPGSLHITRELFFNLVHPEDREPIREAIEKAVRDRSHYSVIHRLKRPNGDERIVHETAQLFFSEHEGRLLKLVGTTHDITDQRVAEASLARLNRSLRMMSACHESLIHATDEGQLIDQICHIAVDIGGYRMAWVGYARDDAERSITPMAWAGAESGYLTEIKLSWAEDDLIGRGPAGQSIRSGQVAISPDIARDQEGFYWQEAALSRDFRSVVCLPLRDGARTFGLLALYSAEVSQAGAEELKLLQELAADLAFGIRSIRSRIEQQRTHEVVLRVAQAVSTSAGGEFFDTLTRNMVEAVGGAGGAVGKINRLDRNLVDTLSFFVGGKLLDNVCYNVTGTPCEEVTQGHARVFPHGIQQRFPDDHMLVDLGLEAYAGIPLRTPHGEVTGLMAVFFNRPMENVELVLSTLKIFAARAGAEIERQEADARIREQASLLDKARDAILVRDLDHQVTYWNKSAERLYGWTALEAIGSKINTLLYRDDAAFREATRCVLANGEWTGELEQIDKEGVGLIIEGRWTLVHDEKGRPKSILAINTDITERRRLEAQFLRTQRMESIGTLAGGIAHDLNNVLAPMLMSIQLLRGYVSESSGKEILEILESSTQRGADLVRQVLSFARGVEGRRVRINPYVVVQDIEKIIRDTFPKNIQSTVERPLGIWAIHGDPTHLHQVLMNLCVNARDAMASGGKLTISIENVVLDEVFTNLVPDSKPGAYVMIMVADTGIGMPNEILDKIFEPFFTTKDIGHGTGLGLSTTLGIVRSHGGFINVYSEPGKGTKFKVYFPTDAQDVTPEFPIAEHTGLPHGNGELILVVDDEDSVRTIAQKTLERFGYRVITANNGAEAVAHYARQGEEIAMVLTDMAMPVMDGPSTIIALRSMNPQVRIIGSSGLASNRSVTRAVGAGIQHFVPKPYTAETMLKTIRTALTE